MKSFKKVHIHHFVFWNAKFEKVIFLNILNIVNNCRGRQLATINLKTEKK